MLGQSISNVDENESECSDEEMVRGGRGPEKGENGTGEGSNDHDAWPIGRSMEQMESCGSRDSIRYRNSEGGSKPIHECGTVWGMAAVEIGGNSDAGGEDAGEAGDGRVCEGLAGSFMAPMAIKCSNIKTRCCHLEIRACKSHPSRMLSSFDWLKNRMLP